MRHHIRHCEERSDAAIHAMLDTSLDCFALLAMTFLGHLEEGAGQMIKIENASQPSLHGLSVQSMAVES